MPPRTSSRKTKKSTPNPKQQEAQPSAAIYESIASELVVVDLSSSPVENSNVPEPSTIYTEEDNELPKKILEEQEMIVVESETGIIIKKEENEGLDETVSMEEEDEGLIRSKVVEVSFQEENNGDIGVDDYLNLAWDGTGSAVVLEDTSNLIGGNVTETETNLDAAVIEYDSNLNCRFVEEEEENEGFVMSDIANLNCEDSFVTSGVAGEEREMEAGENAGEGHQNGDGTQGINQDADSNLVEEETPAPHCEETIVLGDGDDVPDVKKGGDMEVEGEKSENSDDDDEEYNEDNGRVEYIVLGDGDDIGDLKTGGDMEGEGERSEDSESGDEVDDEDNGGDEYIVLRDGDAICDVKEGGDMEGEDEKSEDSEDDDEDAEENGEAEHLSESLNQGEGEKSEHSGDDDEDDAEDNGEDEHISEFLNHYLTYKKTEKILEIHVGGLDKAAVEEDLLKIFTKFGEIRDIRIARHSTTKKSKGFGFIRYVTAEQAKNALSKLKDGIEVRGKQVRISASQGNDTLYMGNICRTWRKEKVLETLKGFGIQQVQEMHLPDNPEKDGKIKGFAFLEFSTHTDAMAAFQRLRKPDAIFGLARSAKVAFTPHPSEEVLSQIKTVYVEGLPGSWDEAKVKKICKRYGEITRVELSQNLKRRRKDFGFITFTSRESALACVEGINSFQIGEGEVKVKANMAKPRSKGRLQMVTHGGFTGEKNSKTAEQTGSVKMEDRTKSKGAEQKIDRTEKARSSKMKGHAKSRGAERKGKELAKEKEKAFLHSDSVKGGKSNNHQSGGSEGQGNGMPSKSEKTNRKRKNLPSKLDYHERRDVDRDYSKRPSKKVRGDMRGKQGNARIPRIPRSNPHFREGPVYVANSVAFRNPYVSRYAASATSYPGHVDGANSGSKRHHSDMEPHAGFLEPAVGGKQGRPHARHVEPALGTHGRPHARYELALGTQGRPHARYVEPDVRRGHPHAGHVEPHLGRQVRRYAGHTEPALGTQRQPHARYLGPPIGNQAHDPYDYDPRRVGRYDDQGSRVSAYAGGSALPPSYVPNYTSYAGYEGGASVGNYYQSSRSSQQLRRGYY